MIKKNWIVYLSSLLFLPAVIFISFYFLDRENFFSIQNIEIEVTNKNSIDSVYINPLIDQLRSRLEEYKNKSVIRIDLKAVSKEISHIEWIKNQTIIRKLPGTLVFQIEAHSIPFVFINKLGRLFPVTEEGHLLSQIDTKNVPDVAILSGEVFAKKLELRKKAVDVFNEIPKQGTFSQKKIAEMKFDTTKGFWVKLIKSGLEVKLGEDQFSLKSSRIGHVIDYLEKNNLEAKIIDANLSKKVLVKLRKE